MQFLAFLRVLRQVFQVIKSTLLPHCNKFFSKFNKFYSQFVLQILSFSHFFPFEIFLVLIFYPNTVNFVLNDFGFYFKMVYSVYSVFRVLKRLFGIRKRNSDKIFLSQFFPLEFLRFFCDF